MSGFQNVIPGREAPSEWYDKWADATQQRIDDAADELIEAAAAAGWGAGEPFEDAVRWLTEAAVRKGYHTTTDLSVAVAVGSGVIENIPAKPYSTGRTVPRNPTAQHRRMHRLADRDGGWICQVCGIGLVDMCSDEDMVIDEYGDRMIGPDCTKRIGAIDHKVPRQLGGSNHDDNCRLACEPCNGRKGAA